MQAPAIKTVLCIGAGYVGSMSMILFASKHPNTNFYVFDLYTPLINKWNNVTDNRSTLPIVENKLFELFKSVQNKNIFFISSIDDLTLSKTDLIFICVNTPSTTNHKYGPNTSLEEIASIINKGIELSMTNVYACVKELTQRIINIEIKGELKVNPKIMIQKSTVALSTWENIHAIIHEIFNANLNWTQSEIDAKITVLNIPEFLSEGTAVDNWINPDRVVIGHLRNNEHSKKASEIVKRFYTVFLKEEVIILLDSVSSEMTKLVANAFLAQRISSINSISEWCEKTGADVHKISTSVGSDKRIGWTFLKAGMGFGGSCFKKDIWSWIFLLNNLDLKVPANYWAQVLIMNEYQRLRICKKILDSTGNKQVTLWGLAFKGDIADVRCSNSIFLLSYLLNNQCNVKWYDPYSTDEEVVNELKIYEDDTVGIRYDYNSIKVIKDVKESCRGSSVCVFVNNHSVFKEGFIKEIIEVMNQENAIIFDLFDNYDKNVFEDNHMNYFKLGQ